MTPLTADRLRESLLQQLTLYAPLVKRDGYLNADALVSQLDWLVLLAAHGLKWQAAEAEGHVVTFTETGYGLMHPPSCRPDLIGCWFNAYLADLGYPDEEPGRYRMTRLTGGHVEYALAGSDSEAEAAP